MTLTFITHLPSKTHLVVSIYQLPGHRLLYFLKNLLFSFFPVETSINFVELESLMQHAKFQDHKTSGS